MPPSHSRTYRSDSPARPASSPLVAGPPRASCLNRPSRSPRAAITTVAAAAVSVSTRPVNSCALFSSMVVPPVLCHASRAAWVTATACIRREHGVHSSGTARRVASREAIRPVRGGAVSGRLSGPVGGESRFVGREAELAALGAALSDAANGRGGGLVLISGGPGIGKTTLADIFGRRARAQGAQVVWGGAWEEGGAPPYWPWVQVLRSLERNAGTAALVEAAGSGDGLLAQLVPSLRPSPAA